ncbi:F-box/WD repeat-containing protein 7 [Dissostichus eleginoides]|uniref:F-box/WD repeat-containing protein 7 n=1 Tax=Dissostichus eleginoides TaxID=100907 RepID=A0AAD9F5J8_DISEL|nr:F-box/WD repeat-containing protein 7 [Dissostichus eleginoides]
MGFYGTLKLIFYKMKRKLDHGPDGRPFSSGKKHCKGNGYLSPASLVQATTPTTFGDLRLANGLSAQRRRVTSGPPPSGLQDWLHIFQAWSGPERLLALDELIDRCETGQVKHMMQVIEPQFQRDFISLLPKELALYVLTFLAPKDLLQAAQTCRYWRILAEDNLLWREKCVSEYSSRRRKSSSPPAETSSWKSAFLRQHRIESNWRSGDTREPMFSGDLIVSGSDDNTLRVWSAVSGKVNSHTGGVWCSQMSVATVISGSTDRTLRVWDAESGECVHTLYGHTSTFDGRRVVSGGYDYMFDGAFVVSGSLDTSIRSLTSGMELRENILVSGNADSTVRVWDVRSGKCPNKHQSAVTCLQFCRGLVLSSSDDGTVKLWDLKTGSWVRDVVTLQSRGAGGVVWRIRASDTRLVCAAGSRNGTEETKLLVLDFHLDDRTKEEE